MKEQPNRVTRLLELANLYPSPHNGQPIRLKQISNSEFEMYFERQRGLQATDISFIFSFVSMGVFTKHLELAGRALGHDISTAIKLPKESTLRGEGSVLFGRFKVTWDGLQKNQDLVNTLRFRQTSRKKYYKGLDEQTIAGISQLAGQQGMQLKQLNKEQTHRAIWLNQRAVFDDMFDPPVNRELDHWLRYNEFEKQQHQDGLAYDCMGLNGSVMRYIVRNPRVLRRPGISWGLKQYYLRTMKDESNVFYMLAPFKTETDSYHVGRVIMDIWGVISSGGYYLHPFGTIMSNFHAHQDFLQMAGVNNESRDSSYLVFIFRAGMSSKPVASLRLPYDKHLLMEKNS